MSDLVCPITEPHMAPPPYFVYICLSAIRFAQNPNFNVLCILWSLFAMEYFYEVENVPVRLGQVRNSLSIPLLLFFQIISLTRNHDSLKPLMKCRKLKCSTRHQWMTSAEHSVKLGSLQYLPNCDNVCSLWLSAVCNNNIRHKCASRYHFIILMVFY